MPSGLASRSIWTCPLPNYVAGLRIVFKIRAVNLVETAGIAPVEGNRNVMQFGVSALLVLHRFAGLNLEYGVSLRGSGRR